MDNLDAVKEVNNLIVVEYNNQRVLTTSQLAQAYECEPKQIKQNFNNNKERFEEGKHFFKLDGDALRDFKASLGRSKISTTLKFTSQLYLWTRRGASRHCKMLGTDRAWEMFDILEDSYFDKSKSESAKQESLDVIVSKGLIAAKEILEQQKKQIAILKPKAEFADAVIGSKSNILIGTLAKLITQSGYKIGQNTLFRWMRINGYLGSKGGHYNIPTQQSIRAGLFEVRESYYKTCDGQKNITITPVVTGKGQMYFIKKFKEYIRTA